MRPDFLKLYPQVTISQVCYHTTLRCSAQEPILDQIRFVDIFYSAGIFSDAAARVSSPTGPPLNFSMIVTRIFLSI